MTTSGWMSVRRLPCRYGQFLGGVGSNETVGDEVVEQILEQELLVSAGRGRGRNGGHEVRAL